MGDPPSGRQGTGCTPRAAQGGANRHGNGRTCRHAAQAQGQAAEAGGQLMQAMSRWAAFCTRRGSGEWVNIEKA